tara:strand:- start:129 stop:356 length:228 start_codon:yes stop_codon:yes gene_type:complete
MSDSIHDINKMWQICNLKVGDRIKFKTDDGAVTRWSNRAVWRNVNGFDLNARPTVKFGGWPDFVVRLDEILEVKE